VNESEPTQRPVFGLSRANMRSFHTEASTHDQSRTKAS
jgi:hypothetical protein